MLLGFQVENHKSLREAQRVDLRPAYDRGRPALSVAALYGANASGKSNLLDALRFLHDSVTEQHPEWTIDSDIPRRPFALDDAASHEPSSFVIDILIDQVRYTYGFKVDDRTVREEWCDYFPNGRKRLLFERHDSTVRFGQEIKGARADLIGEMTRPNMLLIGTAARANQPFLDNVVRWFRRSLWFANEQNIGNRRALTEKLAAEPGALAKVIELLRAADLGISDIRIDSEEFEIESIENHSTTSGETENRLLLRMPGDESNIEVRGTGPRLSQLLAQIQISLSFTHHGKSPRELHFDDESRGTRTWFSLIGLTVNAISNGCTLVIDELDTSIHPILLARFIRIFQDESINRNGAQLIFTTHDVSLLGRFRGEEILRRDEVWFADKDHRTGASCIYPLTDFRPRAGLNWERRYLGGSMGAIPLVESDRITQAFTMDHSRDSRDNG